MPAPEALAQASQRIAQGHKHARIKWVISAGDSFGGYARAGEPRTLIALSPLNASWRPPQHVHAWICHTRLQAAGDWAGAKHLNRLENVMARRERAPSDCVEGLMCDAHGQLACGVSSNLFWRDRQGRLCTHPLDDCGVRGRTRARILAAAEAQGEAVRFVAERVADVLAEACELVARQLPLGRAEHRRRGRLAGAGAADRSLDARAAAPAAAGGWRLMRALFRAVVALLFTAALLAGLGPCCWCCTPCARRSPLSRKACCAWSAAAR